MIAAVQALEPWAALLIVCAVLIGAVLCFALEWK